jgi:putative ABC transport system ATP-binding protein
MGANNVVLRTEQLTREVRDLVLVDHVSIEVYEGDVVAIVGPSGAGKSSFLRLLNRLDEPTGGTVFLEGEDYRAIPPRQLRQRVGMVMQFPYLFPGTVAENLRFGPEQRGETLSEVEMAELLEAVGMAGYEQRNVSVLSGGEAQRVSLARSLANSCDVLLMDEPTSALDEKARKEVEALICEIIADERLTALMVTHDVDQARRVAGRTMVMERGGRLQRIGPTEEVLHA